MAHEEKANLNVSVVILITVQHLVLNDTTKEKISKYYSTCNIILVYSDILPLVQLYAFCHMYLHANMN